MTTPFEADRQWARVAAELLACRETQKQAWGAIDNITLGRYLAGEVTANECQVIEAALERYPELRELTDLVRNVLSDYEPAQISAPAAPISAPVPTPAPATLSFRDAQQNKQHKKRLGLGWSMSRSRLALVAAACLLLTLGLFLQQGNFPGNPFAGLGFVRTEAMAPPSLPANVVAIARKAGHTAEELEQTFQDLERLMNSAGESPVGGSAVDKMDRGTGVNSESQHAPGSAAGRGLTGLAATTTQDKLLPGRGGKQEVKAQGMEEHKPTAPAPVPPSVLPAEAVTRDEPQRRNALAVFLYERNLVPGSEEALSGQAGIRYEEPLVLAQKNRDKALVQGAAREKEQTERLRKAREMARHVEPYLHFEQLAARQIVDEKAKEAATAYVATSPPVPALHVVNTFQIPSRDAGVRKKAEGVVQGSADLAGANSTYGRVLFAGDSSERNLQYSSANNRSDSPRRSFENPYPPLDGRRLRAVLPGEVWSGKALNSLGSALAARSLDPHHKGGYGAKPGKFNKGLDMVLDSQILGRIRFCSLKGEDGRLLSYEHNLRWPEFLKSDSFDQPRQRVEQLFAQTVQQARCKERVDVDKVQDLKAQLGQMSNILKSAVAEITPIQYIQARRFLNYLDEGVKLLEDPQVGRHVAQFRVAGARTVRELLQHMNTQALQFAVAPPGEEDAYLQLYQMLEQCQPSSAD